jgi:glycosyltransferase involved in cell wall biosynthesis
LGELRFFQRDRVRRRASAVACEDRQGWIRVLVTLLGHESGPLSSPLYQRSLCSEITPMTSNAKAENPKIAILIPCYNEELTVGQVVREFREQIPGADIYVFDNNSTDRTVDVARQAGAKIGFERRQGKGYVVQTMFREVDADFYVLVDGDQTYPSVEVHRLLAPVLAGESDMAVGSRLTNQSQSEFKSFNRLGNRFFLNVINFIFRQNLTDILSGYRAFNRRFIKNTPIFGGGFEIETELTIKALEHGYRIIELPIDLRARPAGSSSKIRILHDGFLILSSILTLCRDYKPLTFFGSIGITLILLGLIPIAADGVDFASKISFLHLPPALIALGLILSGLLMIMVGLVLHTIARRFQELDHQFKILLCESVKRQEHGAEFPIHEHSCVLSSKENILYP